MINMDFDLNALKIFLAVYENGGIDIASKKLFLSQPAVTISIKKLEQRLNGKLFTRLPRGIVPTEEGKRFYAYCKNGLSQINLGVENFSEETALSLGTLNIGASTSMIKYVLMPKLDTFCKLYPNVKISFTEVIAERLQRYLFKGEIDIAFVEEPIKDLEIYDRENICSLTSCFVAGRNYLKNTLSKEELSREKFAVLKKNTSSRRLFDRLCLEHSLRLEIYYQMASFETLSQFCEKNLAVGFAFKELIEDELKTKKLKEIETDIPLEKSIVYALLPKGNPAGFLCRKFLDFMKEKTE